MYMFCLQNMMRFEHANEIQVADRAKSFQTQLPKVIVVGQVSRYGRFRFQDAVIHPAVVYLALIYSAVICPAVIYPAVVYPAVMPLAAVYPSNILFNHKTCCNLPWRNIPCCDIRAVYTYIYVYVYIYICIGNVPSIRDKDNMMKCIIWVFRSNTKYYLLYIYIYMYVYIYMLSSSLLMEYFTLCAVSL